MQVYVSTCAKYCNGNPTGKWLNLGDYQDKEDFDLACRLLHKDETDPEFMFRDWEDTLPGSVSESHIDPLIWNYLELPDYEKVIIRAFMHATGECLENAMEDAQCRLIGYGSDRAEVAQECLEGTGALDEIPEYLRYYFDFDAYARDMEYEGFHTQIDSTYYLFSGC